MVGVGVVGGCLCVLAMVSYIYILEDGCCHRLVCYAGGGAQI